MSVNLMKVWGPDGDMREVSHLCARDLVQHKGWTVTGPVSTEVAAPAPAKAEEKPAEVKMEAKVAEPVKAEVAAPIEAEEKPAEIKVEAKVAEPVEAEEKKEEKPKRGRPSKK